MNDTMASITSDGRGIGSTLVERLGLTVLGREGHDLKAACIACNSSDAMRVDMKTGKAYCYSCNSKWSPYRLAEDRIGHDAAIALMVELGVFEPSNNKGAGAAYDPVAEVARLKRVSPEALKRYGAVADGRRVIFPMFGPDGKQCSRFTLSVDNGKGQNEKGKPVGLFCPVGLRLEDGSTVHLVEGVKDAAALSDLGFLAIGLPGNRLNEKFAGMFRSVHVVVVPDADKAGENGAGETAKVLYGVAASVRVAKLPTETRETGGADVRDVLALPAGREKIVVALESARLVNSQGQPIDVPDYGGLTCAELMATTFDLRYHVDGILAARQPCIVAGPQKALKTSLLIDLSLSLVTAGHFLGRFPVDEATRVGLMTGESGMSTIQETIRRVAGSARVDPSGVTSLRITDKVPLFGSMPHEDALREWCRKHKLAVVMIDPLYMCLDGDDQANLSAQGQRLRGVNQVCQECGVTLVVCHHSKKETSRVFQPLDLADISGAGHAEWCRQWMLLSRRVPYTAAEPGSHKLHFYVGGSAGHGGLWGLDIEEGRRTDPGGRRWEVTVLDHDDVAALKRSAKQAAREEKDAERTEAAKRSILNAMAKHQDGEVPTRIRDAAGMHDRDFKRAFAQLIDDREIVACEVFRPNRKTPYEGYKLPPQE